MTESAEGRWAGRRLWALTIRALVWITPVLAGWAASAVYVRLVPAPSTAVRLVWLAGLVAVAAVVAHLCLRLARRLLPLAWLLQVDAAFPDAAPSRFHVALQTNRTTDLRSMALDDQAPRDQRVAAERILVLAAALQGHDGCTRGHSERVRAYTRVIAEALGLRGDDLDKLAWAGLLHDVGKLVVEPEVLTKPSRLDEHELRQVHQHPVAGHRIAEPLMPWLGRWGEAILHHHERYDGSGYPFGLVGESISLGGRIVAVADAFEAMTAKRAYNTPRTLAAAREELRDSSGTHFDPAVVRAFLAVPLGQLSRIALPTAGLSVGTALGSLSAPLRQLEGLGTAVARGGAAAGVVGLGIAATVGGVTPTAERGPGPAGDMPTVILEQPEEGSGPAPAPPTRGQANPPADPTASPDQAPALSITAPGPTPRPAASVALPAVPAPQPGAVPVPGPEVVTPVLPADPPPELPPPPAAVEELVETIVPAPAAAVVEDVLTPIVDAVQDPLPDPVQDVVDEGLDDVIEDTVEPIVDALPPPPPLPVEPALPSLGGALGG